jgi:hypothetical protein
MFRSISMLTLLGAAAIGGCSSASTESGADAGAGTGGSAGSGGDGGSGGSAAGAGGSAAGTAGAAAGTGGTGGSAASGNLDAHQFPECSATDNDEPCAPRGFSFVNHAFAHSYCLECMAPGGSLLFTQPKSGTLCLSGSMETVEPDAGGIALVFPTLANENLTGEHQTVVERFNADYLGITQLRFTIDPPPPGGLYLWATTLHKDECTKGDCITGWFELEDWITDIDESGTVTILLTDFIDPLGAEFDARSFGQVGIDVGPGAVDYCVRDFQFLDANGTVVGEE